MAARFLLTCIRTGVKLDRLLFARFIRTRIILPHNQRRAFAVETVAGHRGKVAKGAGDERNAVVTDLLPLGTEALAHLLVEMHAVDQLHLPLARRPLLVGENPDVGGNAGVIEHIGGQSNNRL